MGIVGLLLGFATCWLRVLQNDATKGTVCNTICERMFSIVSALGLPLPCLQQILAGFVYAGIFCFMYFPIRIVIFAA